MSISLKSIRVRFIISLAGNAVRAAASFGAGVLIARGLGPREFGELAFLVGIFASLRPLLDLGSSTAFYTFISQGGPIRPYARVYFAWLAIQLLFMICLVGFLLPTPLFRGIWQGYPRGLVIFGFLAAFLQLQVWTTLTQIGESQRETLVVQTASAAIAIAHLCLVVAFLLYHSLSVGAIFGIIITEYLIAAVVAGTFFYKRWPHVVVTDSTINTFDRVGTRFWRYCRPLMLSAIAGAAFEFGDRWMLQRFGGAINQGVYQAAFQFAAVVLFATTSILQVFWKELSEAHARGAHDRLLQLYGRVSKLVVFAGGTMAGILVPWSDEIVHTVLGPSFHGSGLVLALLFLYPVHQALGQVTGTLAFAAGETAIYGKVLIAFSAISLVASYLLQAPSSNAGVPGLGLGAMGLAIKTVGVNIVSVNTMGWLLARRFKWPFEWRYQVVGIGLALVVGVGVKLVLQLIWRHGNEVGVGWLLFSLVVTGVFVAGCQAAAVMIHPNLVGLTRAELSNLYQAVQRFVVKFAY